MKKFIIFTIIVSLFLGAFFICLNQPVFAVVSSEPVFGSGGDTSSIFNPLTNIDIVGQKAKYATGGDMDIRLAILLIVQNILLFVGFVFVILLIYGGYLWMTAGGNEEQLTKAKKTIVNSVIAVLIIFLSVSITYTLNNILYNITTQRSIEAGVNVDRGGYIDYEP